MCPQLEMSDNTEEKKCKICPTKLDVSDNNYKNRNMFDKCVRQKLKKLKISLTGPDVWTQLKHLGV